MPEIEHMTILLLLLVSKTVDQSNHFKIMLKIIWQLFLNTFLGWVWVGKPILKKFKLFVSFFEHLQNISDIFDKGF